MMTRLAVILLVTAAAAAAEMLQAKNKPSQLRGQVLSPVAPITTEPQLLWQESVDEFRRRQTSSQRQDSLRGIVAPPASQRASPKQQSHNQPPSGQTRSANIAVLNILQTVAAQAFASPDRLGRPIHKTETTDLSYLAGYETSVREITLQKWMTIPIVQCTPGVKERFRFCCRISNGAVVLAGRWFTRPMDEFDDGIITLNNGTFLLTLSFNMARLKGRFTRTLTNGTMGNIKISFDGLVDVNKALRFVVRGLDLDFTSKANKTNDLSSELQEAVKGKIYDDFFKYVFFDTMNENATNAEAVKKALAKYSPQLIAFEIKNNDNNDDDDDDDGLIADFDKLANLVATKCKCKS